MIPRHWREAALSPPTAWGGPLAAGVLRATPEDFKVSEILGFEPSHTGPHALLTVRKRGANTEWVARQLARVAGCKPFEVGFAGLKDRNAVTTQAFTVPRGKRSAAQFIGHAGEGYEVIAAAEHQRKLPRGALQGNRFEITVRDFHCNADELRARLQAIGQDGVPNYFGPQRFGRDAGNLAEVLRAAQRPAARAAGRGQSGDGFMLSAARSVIFNAILAARVAQGDWNRLLAGDVANLDGRGSVFQVAQPDAALEQRCGALEVHPTAPLWGDGVELSAGEVRSLEQQVATRFPEALAVIAMAGMKAERRALRMRMHDLAHDYDAGVLRLRFALPAGSFATAVLREIMPMSEAGE